MGLRRRIKHTPNATSLLESESQPLQQDNLRLLGRILGYLRPYSWMMLLAIVTLVISVGLSLVLPLVIRNLVDFVLVDKDMAKLNQLAIGLLVVFVLQLITSFIHQLSLAYVGEHAIADIRISVYKHLQQLPLSFYAETRTGEIVSRLTNDVTLLQQAITNNLVMLLRQALTFLGATLLLFYLNWRLSLLILLVLPVVTLLMVRLGARIRKESTMVQDALADVASVAEETTSGARIVKSFTREDYEIGRFTGTVMNTYAAAMRRARIYAVLSPSIGFIASLTITGVLFFGSFQVIQGNMTAGDLIAYLIYSVLVATPIAIMADLYGQFQAALGASERLFALQDLIPKIQDAPNAVELPLVEGQVVFTDVSFRYTDEIPVLHHVDFSAEPGQVVALVGPSGAGKSSLVNLIPRFYDVNSGSIRIDNYDVRDVTQRSLREQIGIVPQETILFSGSVIDNIRYGRLEATDEEVADAARAANAHDFIVEDLANSYDTPVGEHGAKLSGGQRQRIAIARAILKNPRILILDEATSSLDSESEAQVQEALEHLMYGRTSFVIAHRLSTVINADWILVLNKGEVVEQGTHASLLLNGDGLYNRLYRIQFAADIAS